MSRFLKLYERRGVRSEVLNNTLWAQYGRMVIPVGPAKFNYSISEKEARFLLSRFPGTILVRYTDGFGGIDSCMEWYALICDKFTELDGLSGNTRSKVRRGLKNCIVEKVDADFIAEYGYEVFISAFERYRDAKRPDATEPNFKKRILISKDFDDIVHYWGVLYGGKLIAYSENHIYDHVEVNYSTIKFHPDFLKLYPSYSLTYTMNSYYLKEKDFEYVNDGFRSLLHQTNIQDYLIDKFKFKKANTRLYAVYKPCLSICLSITFPLRNFLNRVNPRLAAIYKLEEIRRVCQNV